MARWLPRLLLGVTGLAWFFWLGIEDRNEYFVLGLGLLAVINIMIHLPVRAWVASTGNRIRLLVVALVGSLAGAAVPLIAVVLMFMKVSLHDHPVPDFSLQQVLSVLAVTPVWAVAGALLFGAWWLVEGSAG